ncbi:MAG: pyridoxamine 5'-phosphate oxidase family protein [Armatimonadetes bacterium]|nr:pyridoxamine 5'-phosphate oxidase family protein [Armatimonadota bacterium]
MELIDCTRFANENPICYLATTDGDQPRVRGFMLWFADDTGFYFHSGSPKAVCRQLIQNPKTEVCFYAPAPLPDGGTMMRVAGEVEFLDDRGLKARLLEERPWLKDMGTTGPDDPNLAVFRISTGEAHFWTLADNMRESEVERISF